MRSDEQRRTELDSRAADVVASFEARGVPPWHSLSIDSARALEDDLFGGGGPSVEDVFDVEIPGPSGAVPIRIYRDGTDAAAPAIVFYHGGGWVLGTLDSADDICRELAARTGCLVVSVDYRLAPEHPFPAPLADAVSALEWVAEYGSSIGADADRIGVAGTSAGGNLAAATALYARDSLPISVVQQTLLYPMIDPTLEAESVEENADGPFLTRADLRWFWDRYLRHPIDARNPLASVSRAPDLSGLPPATVLTCGHDPLRDEGIAYARSLSDDGVDVTHEHRPSLPHGALSLTDEVETATETMTVVTDEIRSRFERV